MGFPDEETMIWAKKKFGGGGCSGGMLKMIRPTSEQQNNILALPMFPAEFTVGLNFFKISDFIPTIEELANSIFCCYAHDKYQYAATDENTTGDAETFVPSLQVFEDEDISGLFLGMSINDELLFLVATQDAVDTFRSFGVEGIEPGTYFDGSAIDSSNKPMLIYDLQCV